MATTPFLVLKANTEIYSLTRKTMKSTRVIGEDHQLVRRVKVGLLLLLSVDIFQITLSVPKSFIPNSTTYKQHSFELLFISKSDQCMASSPQPLTLDPFYHMQKEWPTATCPNNACMVDNIICNSLAIELRNSQHNLLALLFSSARPAGRTSSWLSGQSMAVTTSSLWPYA